MDKNSYHYGNESDMYRYIQVPILLLDAPEYQSLSAESILLYALMLNRMGLSARNNWQDAEGRTYIYFKKEEAMRLLHVQDHKAVKMYKELETAGLIERTRQGQGKPSRIYVMKFTKRTSRSAKSALQEVRKSNRPYLSKKKYNYTEGVDNEELAEYIQRLHATPAPEDPEDEEGDESEG